MRKLIKAEDRIGTIVNGFKILDVRKISKYAEALAVCPFCGNQKWIRIDTLLSEKVVSCGCYNKKNNYKKPRDITGKRFGRLVAIERIDKYKDGGGYFWKCKCDCGNIKNVPIRQLIDGNTKSCGCLQNESAASSLKIAKNEYEKYRADGSNILYARTNKKPPSTNKSGILGVSWNKARQKWVAQITFKGKNYHLGRYDDIKLAEMARKEAEEKLYGDFQEWYSQKFPEMYQKLKEKGKVK